jgi:hypothetical protein
MDKLIRIPAVIKNKNKKKPISKKFCTSIGLDT